MKDLVPVAEAIGLPLLFVSWLLFVGSILCTLCSFMVSRRAYDFQLKVAHEYYLEEKEESFNKKNPHAHATERLNRVAGLFFALALLTTLLFVVPNVWMAAKIEPMSKSTEGPESRVRQVNEAAVPPAMARVPSEDRGSVPAQMPRVPVQQTPTPPPPVDSDKK